MSENPPEVPAIRDDAPEASAPDEPTPFTGCYQCGSPGGTMLKLCQGCVDRAEAARLRLKERLRIERDAGNDPLVYKVVNSPGLQLIAALVLSFILSSVIFGLAVSVKTPPVMALVFGVIVACAAITTITWLMIWMNMLMVEPILAVVCILFPPFAYRRVFHFFLMRHDDDSWRQFKPAVFSHFGAIVLFIASVTMLAAFDFRELQSADYRMDKKYGVSIIRLMSLPSMFKGR